MANLTLSIPDELLAAAREAAFRRGTTVNAICRETLERLVGPERESMQEFERLFALADKEGWRSSGKWTREEMYEERLGRMAREP